MLFTKRWLQKIVTTAYSDEKIGIISPLSNTTKFISDIIAETTNNQQLEPNEIAYLIESVSEHLRPEINSTEGLCIYIKRKAINDVKQFNEGIKDIKKAKKRFYQEINTDSTSKV